ncbi:MAG: transglycosylase domain-containing protein [candidate division WWE3 bacterium]|nr:transglycosylase domain-containing protein [candidate division WWE3 bacterium]
MEKFIRILWNYYLKIVEVFLILIFSPINWGILAYLKLKRTLQTSIKLMVREIGVINSVILTRLIVLKKSIAKNEAVIKGYLADRQKKLKYKIIWEYKDLLVSAAELQAKIRITIINFIKLIKRIIKRRPKAALAPKRTQLAVKKANLTIPNNKGLAAYKITASILISISLILTTANGAYAFYQLILKDLPSPETLSTNQPDLTTKILDRNGVLLYKIHGPQNRTWITLSDIPKTLTEATISMEDKDFYTNPGFSVSGIVRAAVTQARGGAVQGGSTITQQLVKNVFLTPDRTIVRKTKELILAVETERHYSKDQILEMYLNINGYGGSSYGVEEAAQEYFGISARNLDLAQSALLAGLTASPTTYSPFGVHPEMAKERQRLVLQRMLEDGKITYDQMEAAVSEPLNIKPQVDRILAPHFVMWVKQLLVDRYGEDVVDKGGLTVKTSLDINLQNMVQTEVQTQLGILKFENVTNGAAMITKPATGEVLAMVGSRDYFDLQHDGNVNVALSLRQPGSSIKVVNYAGALEDGFTAATRIVDAPISFPSVGGPTYNPVNYDGKFHGNVTVRTALASSFNIPAVKVLAAQGVPKMVAKGIEMGLTSWQNVDPGRFGLSMTLGSIEVPMTQMMVVYGDLANGGKQTQLNPFLEVKDSAGLVLESQAADPKPSNQVVKPGVAYIISNILSDNNARIPAFGPSSVLNIPGYTVAVKTGTTNELRDNWTFGYTPDYVVGTWVGNNDNTPMSGVASGITGASPIWHNIMTNLLTGQPTTSFVMPSDVTAVNLCPYTGTLACNSCQGQTEYFIKGSEPKTACSDEVIKKN